MGTAVTDTEEANPNPSGTHVSAGRQEWTSENLCVVVHPMTGNDTELVGWWTGQAAPRASDEKVELGQRGRP